VGAPADTFVDAAGGNYRPNPGGPAAGRGDATAAPPTDIDGAARTPPVEAGAYEIVSGPPPADGGPGTPDARPAGTPDARPVGSPDGGSPPPPGDAGAPAIDAPAATADAAAGGPDARGAAPGAVTGCSCGTCGAGSSLGAILVIAVAALALRRRAR
jgi:uncharacterized protein (TIGR03382 family)